MILTIVFWVLLLLCVFGRFAPDPYVKYFGYLDFVFLALLGWRVFPPDLH
jgi:hypothetical protein